MFWRNIRSNLIKWWRICYIPIARKIFPTRQEQEAYEAAQKNDDETSEIENKETDEKQKHKSEIDPDLLHNKKYNVTTGAMSGEYGTHEMDDDQKAKLDSILNSNYNTTNLVESLIAEQSNPTSNPKVEKLCDTSNLDAAEAAAKEEQIRKANEIYERLLQEAKEDELKRQQEIMAAMQQNTEN